MIFDEHVMNQKMLQYTRITCKTKAFKDVLIQMGIICKFEQWTSDGKKVVGGMPQGSVRPICLVF